MKHHIKTVVIGAFALLLVPALVLWGLSGCTENPPEPESNARTPLSPQLNETTRPQPSKGGAVLVDFEAISTGQVDGYWIDPSTGVAFSAAPATGVVGPAAVPVVARFAAPVAPPVTISVEFYTGADATCRARLFAASGEEVAAVERPALPCDDDVHSSSSPLGSRTVVTATANEPVSSVVFSASEKQSAPVHAGDDAIRLRGEQDAPTAFVIDNLRFGTFVTADLDIRPGSCPNPFNPKSKGVMRAAILGSADFDVSEIDVSTVHLEGAAPVAGRESYHSIPGAPGVACACDPGKPDDFVDLILKFRTQDVADAIQPVWPKEVRELTLAGSLQDGTPFEATDCVTIVGVQEPDVEIVSAPDAPLGPSRGLFWPKFYCARGSESSQGHPIEYRFLTGDVSPTPTTEWSDDPCTSLSWNEGTHVLWAQARCAIHTEIVSELSDALTVTFGRVDDPPTMHFSTIIDGVARPYTHQDVPPDTVGMFVPFGISYHGSSVNGPITAYRYFPLSTTIEIPGSIVWSTDLSDTVRSFPNTGDQTIPSSVFRFAARCLDESGAVSNIDAGRFSQGVCQVVVNFDPDTRIDGLTSIYVKNGAELERDIDFTDGVPDTVPYKSWVNMQYTAWDDNRDVIQCSPLSADRCINFQIKYERVSARIRGSFGSSGWIPRGAAHDSDTLSASDSNKINMGSVEYTLFARGIDENLKADGTPARVEVIANYDPTLASVTLADHFGNEVDINSGIVDTLTWNFWKGVGWPYDSQLDTLDITDPNFPFIKRFQWRLQAGGFDHPDDPAGSGIKAWRYLVFDDDGNIWPLARAGETWVPGDGLNRLDEVFELTFRYPGPIGDDPDHCGNTVFENLPAFLNRDLTIQLMGRDTAIDEQDFDQFVYLAPVAPGEVGNHGGSERFLINAYPVSMLGRYTEEKIFTFHLRLIRDPEPDPEDCLPSSIDVGSRRSHPKG